MIRTVANNGPLNGTVVVPGDKSISHRYAMLAAISEGESELRHYATSRDCHSTLECLKNLGIVVSVNIPEDTVRIAGLGLRGFTAPDAPLDAGNSGTTMRLLSGILAGQSFNSTLTGDDSLLSRPMNRIAEPLGRMGAVVTTGGSGTPPLSIRGTRLRALRYRLPVASAQVKSCILLAGLYADGVTAVQEPAPTRDHTERALRIFGAEVSDGKEWIEVEPDPILHSQDLDVPGDPSSAAYLVVAAALLPDSKITLPGIGLNTRRRSLLTYLEKAGLVVQFENETERADEARGDIKIQFSPALLKERLKPIHGDMVASLIDEIPILAVLGSQAKGGIEIRDAKELRFKESDRIAGLVQNLRLMGAEVQEFPDGLRVNGPVQLYGTDIESGGDHRIAMSFAIAGMLADGETRIHQAECADISFLGFWDDLAGLVQSHRGSQPTR